MRRHPRNTEADIRKLFSWVAQDWFSDPIKTPLAEDIGSAGAAIMVRSTVALDAMFAGVPMIWLSPSKHRAELESYPVRKQRLALLDAATPEELRGIWRSSPMTKASGSASGKSNGQGFARPATTRIILIP